MTLKNILKVTFTLLLVAILTSCKSNNYRTFEFYNIQQLDGSGVVSNELLKEYENTTVDVYEDKLVFHNGLKSKTYEYTFNAGYLEVPEHKNATYQIKNDELRIELKIDGLKVLVIYKVVK